MIENPFESKSSLTLPNSRSGGLLDGASVYTCGFGELYVAFLIIAREFLANILQEERPNHLSAMFFRADQQI